MNQEVNATNFLKCTSHKGENYILNAETILMMVVSCDEVGLPPKQNVFPIECIMR